MNNNQHPRLHRDQRGNRDERIHFEQKQSNSFTPHQPPPRTLRPIYIEAKERRQKLVEGLGPIKEEKLILLSPATKKNKNVKVVQPLSKSHVLVNPDVAKKKRQQRWQQQNLKATRPTVPYEALVRERVEPKSSERKQSLKEMKKEDRVDLQKRSSRRKKKERKKKFKHYQVRQRLSETRPSSSSSSSESSDSSGGEIDVANDRMWWHYQVLAVKAES